MKLPGSLRSKVMTLVLTVTFGALILANGIFLYYDRNNFRMITSNDMRTQIELLSYSSLAALQFEDNEVANSNLALLTLRPSVRAAAIYDADGQLFASYTREGVSHEFPVLPGIDGIHEEQDLLIIFSRIMTDNQILGTAYLISDFRLRERTLSYIRILGSITLLAMALAAALSFWLQSLITRPVLDIVDIARKVATHNDFSLRARKTSNDEVGELVTGFNNMLSVIESGRANLETTNKELETKVAEVTKAREMYETLNVELEKKVLERTQQLELSNHELESFCYSVSHDLRGPLRAISGFGQALSDELPAELPAQLRHYLTRIIAGTQRMGQLIEDLLNLSRVSRGELNRKSVNMSEMAKSFLEELKAGYPERSVEISIWDNIVVDADPKLLHIVLSNLLSNAWKFSSKSEHPMIMLGMMKDGANTAYFVRDNGAGFDMKYADKLFVPFQRLHAMHEFPGTGVGLATVQRIIQRHGGRIWFDAEPGVGAVFYFTLKQGA